MIKYQTYAGGQLLSVNTGGLSGAEHQVSMAVDKAASKGMAAAAAAGVPWAIVGVLIKKIIVFIAKAIAGDKGGCLGDVLGGPTYMALIVKGAIGDYLYAWSCSGTPGTQMWAALKPALESCGFSPLSVANAEGALFSFMAGQSFCKSTNNKIRARRDQAKNKAKALQKEQDQAMAAAANAAHHADVDKSYDEPVVKKKADNTMLYVAAGAIVLFAVAKKKS